MRRRGWPRRLALALGLALVLGGCAFPRLFVSIDPKALAVLQGDRGTVVLGATDRRCPDDVFGEEPLPCADITGQAIDYVVQGLPSGVDHALDTSLRSPSTPDVVRLTLDVGAQAPPGLYEVAIQAVLQGRVLGTGALGLRVLPAGGTVLAPSPVAVAAGGDHTLALLADGSLWAWGSNASGQLGTGTLVDSAVPVPVGGVQGVVAIAAGDDHSLALTADGSVWAWGDNNTGEIGDGTHFNTRRRPVRITALSGITAIAAGSSHSLALAADGTVWAWGSNARGKLGLGDCCLARAVPAQVRDLAGVIAIAASFNYSLALTADGSVWIWGSDRLGDPESTGAASSPVRVEGLDGVQAIAAGSGHVLALRTDGTVWAWGANEFGELGDGSTLGSVTPVQVLGAVQAIAAGAGFSLALGTDGSLWSWGRVTWTGVDGDVDRLVPGPVPGFSSVRAIVASFGHSMALLECGQLWAWGSNQSGQLGTGTGETHRRIPAPVIGLGDSGACDRVVLRVTVAGDTYGEIRSGDGGPSCFGSGCTQLAILARGAAVTLSAVPGANAVFEGWAVDCQGSGPQLVVTMDTSKHCAAVLRSAAPEPFLLSVTTGQGRVTSSGGGILGPDHIDCGATCAAIFQANTLVTMAASPAAGFGFAGWGGACSGTDPGTTVLVDRRVLCTASFEPFSLAVAVVAGEGRVTSEPAGIDCGAACAFEPRTGAVTLSATPALGWQLDGWGGDCAGAAPSVELTMDADRSCTASFSRIPGMFLLTMTIEGDGAVTSAPAGIDCPPVCVGLFPAGPVELTAHPGPSSIVSVWLDDCLAGGVPTRQVVMDADKQCRIRFVGEPPFPVAAFSFPSPRFVGQPVIFDGNASHVFDPVTGTRDPAGIRTFAWNFDNTGVFEVSGSRTSAGIVQHAFQTSGIYEVRLRVTGGPFDLSDDRVQQIEILEPAGALFGLTVGKAGGGDGTIATDPPGLIACGPGCASAGPVLIAAETVVTLVATPDAGSTFSGWSGDCTGAAASVQVTMDAVRSCTATFTADAFVLSVSHTGNGRVTSAPAGIDCGAACTAAYAAGTIVMLTAVPDAGFRFESWSQDCAGGSPSVQVTLSTDRSCHATFSPDTGPFTLTVVVDRPVGSIGRVIGVQPADNVINCAGAGSVCEQTFPAGTVVVVRPSDTSIELELFGGWQGCDALGSLASCTVTMTGHREVTATFVR